MRKIRIITYIICIVILFYSGFRYITDITYGEHRDPIFFWAIMVTASLISLISLPQVTLFYLKKHINIVGIIRNFFASIWAIILLILSLVNEWRRKIVITKSRIKEILTNICPIMLAGCIYFFIYINSISIGYTILATISLTCLLLFIPSIFVRFNSSDVLKELKNSILFFFIIAIYQDNRMIIMFFCINIVIYLLIGFRFTYRHVSIWITSRNEKRALINKRD